MNVTRRSVYISAVTLVVYLLGITIFLALALSRKWIALPQWWDTRNAAVYRAACGVATPLGEVASRGKVRVDCAADHGFFTLKLKNMPLTIETPDLPATASSDYIENQLNALLHQVSDYDAAQEDSAFDDYRYRDGTSNIKSSSRFRVDETFAHACTAHGNTWHISHEAIANIPSYWDGELHHIALMEATEQVANTQRCATFSLTNAD